MPQHGNELRETVRAAFAHFDVDGSGAIDARELHDLVAELGGYLTETELKSALLTLDRDRNGVVDEHEFTTWWMAQSGDLDGDGHVGEMERAMERVKTLGHDRFRVDIHSAAWRGTLAVVHRLLQSDAELANASDATEYGCGNTPLHYAAYQGHVQVCAALLTAGAKINAINGGGCTPLFLATQQSRLPVVQLLLEHDADIRIAEREHTFTAVDVCASDEILAAFRARSGGVPCAPDAPTIARTSDSSCTVEWTTPRDRHDQLAPISGYKLRATPSSEESSTSATVRCVLVGAQPTQWELTDLQPDTEYVVHVAAINLHGISPFSDGSPPTRTRTARPSAPSQLHAHAVDSTTVELTWMTEAAGEESQCVLVQQCVDDECDLWKQVNTTGDNAHGCVVSALFPDRKYRFRVAVADITGAKSDFASVDVRTAPERQPPRATLRGIVDAAHRRGSESKKPQAAVAAAAATEGVRHRINGGDSSDRYPLPQNAVETHVHKPRLLTIARRAVAKPPTTPATSKPARVDRPTESEPERRSPMTRNSQSIAEEAAHGSNHSDPKATAQAKANSSTRENKRHGCDGEDEDGEDEDDYVYFSDDQESDSEDKTNHD